MALGLLGYSLWKLRTSGQMAEPITATDVVMYLTLLAVASRSSIR